MLIIDRKEKQGIRVRIGGETFLIRVTKITGTRVSLGFEGPEFEFVREESHRNLPLGVTDLANIQPKGGVQMEGS